MKCLQIRNDAFHVHFVCEIALEHALAHCVKWDVAEDNAVGVWERRLGVGVVLFQFGVVGWRENAKFD